MNGVSNNARMETIKENSDVIDGVEFVGTLDGKTCQYCAAYDGHIWRGEDAGKARRPPLHPNCRCTIIPYVELKDENGNVVELEADRPAANADFDKLAKDSYNQQAREKGWSRRWEDLSASTRLKYFYKAQKNFEKETGKKAFEQVSGKTTFEEYFKAQPESFKSSWLGAKRYELYKQGKLKDEQIFSPNLDYTVPVTSLLDVTKEELEEFIENTRSEDIRLDGKDLLTALRHNGFKESLKPLEEIIAESQGQNTQDKSVKGFVKTESLEDAEKFIFAKFGIKAQYRKKLFRQGVPLDVANDLNQELCRAYNVFGTVGIIENIQPDASLLERDSGASYNRKTGTISIRPVVWKNGGKTIYRKNP